MTDKKALRQRLRADIEGLSADYLRESNRGIYENLLPLLRDATRVFIYYSMGREVDTRPIISWLLEQKKDVFLPVTHPKGFMEAALVTDVGKLVPGVWGILQPDTDAPRVQADSLDLIVTPGLAFDRFGYRMGQGGGYYDRYLKSGRPAVGLCRDRLFLDCLPREAHDMAVSYVVTEKEVSGPHSGAPKPSGLT